tara:strand:- start:22307 stop:22540 length:234 start_codon:yes stop_codon:yes gene_type:complete
MKDVMEMIDFIMQGCIALSYIAGFALAGDFVRFANEKAGRMVSKPKLIAVATVMFIFSPVVVPLVLLATSARTKEDN